MKRLAIILIALANLASALAQTAPALKHSVDTNGDLILTWPVQIIPTRSTNLNASYQLEFAPELNNWTPLGALIRGTNFPAHTASIRLTDVLTRPASFLRVRAVLDFAGANFIGKIMTNAPLTNAVFTGANFFGAQLDGASFDGADLSAADFRFATMTQITARNADFTLARLADADLTSADLSGASLVLAELSGATLDFADLSGADLRGAILQDNSSDFTRLHNTTIDDTTIFDARSLAIWLIVNNKGANRTYTDVDLSFADLSGGNLTNATLAGIDLSGVDFTHANLSGANLTNSILRLLDLRGTIIDDATNITNKWRTIWDIINNPRPNRSHPNTDLSLGFWIDATFESADVHNANFALGIMENVNFENANAAAANFKDVEFHGADFKNADAHGASFEHTLLDSVNFLGANITNAIFLNATFHNTTMPDGTIRN
jgi:uncharacterized protein YjbI with pentapeptide repeats